jgi:chemotaxis-related protein WspD
VWGDHSCAELPKWIHCQNCPVLRRSGLALFEQPAPRDYLDEWENLLAAEQDARAVVRESILVFRLGTEWLGLRAAVFQSIEEIRVVRRIPRRSNQILLGLVNIRGGLQICVSLRELLEIPAAAEDLSAGETRKARRRLALVSRAGENWAFPVDEALGVHRHEPGELQNLPVTVAKAAASFTKGILRVQGRTVGLLDEELVFFHLKRKALA